MSPIDPLQMMTLMGTAPERKARKATPLGGFHGQMRQALGGSDRINAIGGNMGGSPLESALMQDALNGLAAIMTPRPQKNLIPSRGPSERPAAIGDISAAFESGTQGVGAIGHDRNGGTSYGTYQIASKPGTMKEFIDFLRDREPRWAQALKTAGPADTGSTRGRMPAAWQSIAAQDPDRFGQLQREFIEATHYQPARDKIFSKTGIDIDTMPAAAREALWSTAVQHGPAGAARIFNRAISAIGSNPSSPRFAKHLIDTVYESRTTQFGSSTPQVQASVRDRMQAEKGLVLAMLEKTADNLA